MSFVPSASLAAAFAPLRSAFGSGLRVERDGDSVRWQLDGRETIVEASGNGSVRVTFAERVTRDIVAETAAVPLYRTTAEYRLTSEGAGRLAGDIVAFFRGAREPRFSFFGFDESALVRS